MTKKIWPPLAPHRPSSTNCECSFWPMFCSILLGCSLFCATCIIVWGSPLPLLCCSLVCSSNQSPYVHLIRWFPSRTKYPLEPSDTGQGDWLFLFEPSTYGKMPRAWSFPSRKSSRKTRSVNKLASTTTQIEKCQQTVKGYQHWLTPLINTALKSRSVNIPLHDFLPWAQMPLRPLHNPTVRVVWKAVLSLLLSNWHESARDFLLSNQHAHSPPLFWSFMNGVLWFCRIPWWIAS